MKSVIDTQKLERWAGFLIDHSLGGVKPGERVMIKGEDVAWPLMAVLERRVIEAGGLPDVLLVPRNNERGRVWSSAMARSGSEEQLAAVPAWHLARYESMDKYVEVLGAAQPELFADLTPAQAGLTAKADMPFSKIRLAKNWVITLFPTEAGARSEGMSLEEYSDFIVRASTEDPSGLLQAEEKLAPLMAAAGKVEIVTRRPGSSEDLLLTMDITQGHPMMSHGMRNFPDGEIFTSPDARTPEGEIYLDLPITYGGVEMRGIWFRLEGGRIVDYSAEEGREGLKAIVETDEGSRRLGEVALGMNAGLDKVLKHPLFVEKVGGTLHIAVGASYETCFVEDPGSDEGAAKIKALENDGVLNRSAQHVDLVADFRSGGCGVGVKIDGRSLVVENGVWVPA